MLIYNQADRKSVERAIAKAKSVKPLARINGYGSFSVAGSKPGQRYEVRFEFNRLAELVVSCSCSAGLKGAVCYHAAATAGIFKGQWTEKKRAAQAAPPVSYCGCGLPTAGLSSYCQACAILQAAGYADLLADIVPAPAPAPLCAWHRGCNNESEAGAYCLDHALELAADKSELFG